MSGLPIEQAMKKASDALDASFERIVDSAGILCRKHGGTEEEIESMRELQRNGGLILSLRPCAATNGHEDRDDAVAQGGIERPCSPGAGEVAGSSPASVTIKERLINRGDS